MRKIALLICMLASIGCIYSDEYQILDSIVTSTLDGLSSKTTYVYDENQNQALVLFYRYTQDTWVLYQKLENTYQNANQLVSMCVYDMNGDTWKESMRMAYAYDDNGNQISAITSVYFSYTDEWCEMYKEEYSYNSDNIQTETRTYGWRDEGWLISLKTVNDIEGTQVSGSTTYVYTENEWVKRDKVESSYGENGMVKEHLSYSWSGTEWTKESKTEFDYDADNHIILQIWSGWEDDEWKDGSKTEYEYFDHLIHTVDYSYAEGTWTIDYIYDSYYAETETALTEVQNTTEEYSCKVLRDGRLYIINHGKIYDITGRAVR